MSIGVEALFTSALGLKSPWEVTTVNLDTSKRRIDFEIDCNAKRLPCPACAMEGQRIHDRVKREWRHLDFFQHEAWLHASVPRVDCSACGKTTTVEVPWARPGSGFTLLFEAFALSLCQSMPVAHAASLLRVADKQLWGRILHYTNVARQKEIFKDVAVIGIDELSFRRGQDYVTLVHDLDRKRLLFMTEGRKHGTVGEFKEDLIKHGGDPDDIKHVCMDMSAAYTKGVTEILPQAQISFDRFHVIALANEAMDKVRREEMRQQPRVVKAALGTDRKSLKGMFWGMRKDHSAWNVDQINTMYRLQRSNLKSARAWRLKEGLRSCYTAGVTSNCPAKAEAEISRWISWARRSRLEPFKKLATTLKDRLGGVVRGMLDGRSNAYVEAMNGMLQQVKRAARGFRTTENFIAIAFLRMGKLTNLPTNPMQPAKPIGSTIYRNGRPVPLKNA